MRIAFYTPFKPLNHHHPSGDLVIAQGLYKDICQRGHRVYPVGPLRARWIYWKPWLLLPLLREYGRAIRQVRQNRIDLWLTYHTYYKAPDVLGPTVSKTCRTPYVIFQGIFSTKRQRHWKTWPGFQLNKQALKAATHVFSNRQEDWINLRRIVLPDKLTYLPPGIWPQSFCYDDRSRKTLRRSWGVDNEPVVLSAAMFRPDVKTQGMAWLIRSCGRLFKAGIRFYLVIAGDGKEKEKLKRLAERHLPERVRFVGEITRQEMVRFYSAGDLFAFPGIRESLGMVYLESQSCGLPVVAFDNGGIPEVVDNGKTAFLVPMFDEAAFDLALKRLILDKDLRRKMGAKAKNYVREHHDLQKNYHELERRLKKIVTEKQHAD
jgi:glycosyltransferase involved in cell wall biosynthesis